MSFGLFFVAGSVFATSHYTADDLDEIKATEYTDIDGEWEVEFEFANDSEYKFTLTGVADKDVLHDEVAQTIEDKYEFAFSADDVAGMIEYEEEDEQKDEDEDEDDEEGLEIKADKEDDDKWEIEYESGDEKEKFFVSNVSDEDDLIAKIADYLGMQIAEVEAVIEIDEDDWKDEDEDDDDDKGNKGKGNSENKGKGYGPDNNPGQAISAAARDQMIQSLLMLIITMLIQGQGGENANVDLSDLLSQLQ